MSLYRDAIELITQADSIAVVGHVRPDADAIGSVCAMVAGLKQRGKHAVGMIGQNAEFAANLLTIPGAEDIQLTTELGQVDLVITVDCGSLDRTGALATQIQEGSNAVLVIDHHSSNPGFGDVNLLDLKAESTTTIIGRLFDELEIQIGSKIAHALYAGLLTDTGSFRWGSSAMHSFAAKLMATGIDVREIAVDMLDSGSIADLQMIGQALSGVKVHHAGRHQVAVIIADNALLQRGSLAAVEGLVDAVRSLDGTDIGAVLKESHPGLWHVSLRSDLMDVSQVAVALGGGGHIPAAGYSASGTAEQVLAGLLGELQAR
ncbi:DHH family phosphoesterase [Corynebacterium alimapuense]|uniref:Exopolyphosphatase n=1 Tax=Corynebacterium alimapuense TaxID=1576874 RepID=A0A3M8K8A7_9CORY|nr:bifunctional oligoribonuclease/PAP phosphatase NrnA [Corynebacterium alimapuense]RNE49376.1 exopolyphosphatase [Corynebacterium alimapuense]